MKMTRNVLNVMYLAAKYIHENVKLERVNIWGCFIPELFLLKNITCCFTIFVCLIFPFSIQCLPNACPEREFHGVRL